MPTPQAPWYKTRVGLAFLTILSFFSLVFLVFASIIGYYAWQIRSGQGDKLAKSIFKSDRLSVNQQTNENTETAKPVQEYITKKNPARGSSDSPLTVVAFLDFLCAHCAESYPILEEVISGHENDIQVIFKHFPLSSNSIEIAVHATCADEQGKFWDFYKLFFESKEKNSDQASNIAEDIGLNMIAYKNCVANKKFLDTITEDLKDGNELGVAGTPTFFVNKVKIQGAVNLNDWEEAIISALK